MQGQTVLVWGGLGLALAVPLGLALASPQLAWRDPIYIVAGFAGVLSLAILLVQPLLASASLPGLPPRRARQAHRLLGASLVAVVLVHVVGLWLTSPPDVIDALLFASPTPFSVWGVIAMWAVFAVAVLAMLRRRLRPKTWTRAHVGLVVVIVGGTVLHALLIEGTMEWISKIVLCALVLAATAKAIATAKL